MFLGKKRSSLPQRMLAVGHETGRRTNNGFHPRLEALEARALPSVNHLPLNLPVVGMVVEASTNVPFTIRIEIITITFQAAPPSQVAAARDSGVDARMAPSAVATSTLGSVDAGLTTTPARGGGAATGTSVEPVSLI